MNLKELAKMICCFDASEGLKPAALAQLMDFAAKALEAAGNGQSQDAVDAARYRFLRMCDWFSSDLCVLRDPKKALTSGAGLGADCPSRDRLDAFIDAATGKQEGGEGA